MERAEIIKYINEAMCNVGCMPPDNIEEDYELIEYIADSLQFISFVVELETALHIEFPDELLNGEILQSRNGFAEMLESLCVAEA